jgi:antirestriction protein ArdC
VAEIGNCMLCAQLGLEPEFDQSAAYVDGWLKALKEDNRAIFRAASEAQKAVDYIMAHAAQVDRMAAE